MQFIEKSRDKALITLGIIMYVGGCTKYVKDKPSKLPNIIEGYESSECENKRIKSLPYVGFAINGHTAKVHYKS